MNINLQILSEIITQNYNITKDRINLWPSKAEIDHHTDMEGLHVFSDLFAVIDPWMFILESVCVCGGCPRLTPALQTLS